MAEWVAAEAPTLAVLLTILALLATLAYRWQVGHRRDFQMLWERIDKEAERRERAFQTALERSDKEAEKRERVTREFTARIDREAAERQQRIDREAAERERVTRELTAHIDREAAERKQLFDKEAEKREQAFQAALKRSDRSFELLTAQTNELVKALAGIAQRTARSEGMLEAMTAGVPRAGSKSMSAADEPHAVAAQQGPGEPPAE